MLPGLRLRGGAMGGNTVGQAWQISSQGRETCPWSCMLCLHSSGSHSPHFGLRKNMRSGRLEAKNRAWASLVHDDKISNSCRIQRFLWLIKHVLGPSITHTDRAHPLTAWKCHTQFWDVWAAILSAKARGRGHMITRKQPLLGKPAQAAT